MEQLHFKLNNQQKQKQKNLIFNLLLVTTMKNYIDLTNTATYEAVATTLIEYGYNGETIDFAFDIYWLNDWTLENLLYWKGIDEEEFLETAWLLEDEEEDE